MPQLWPTEPQFLFENNAKHAVDTDRSAMQAEVKEQAMSSSWIAVIEKKGNHLGGFK